MENYALIDKIESLLRDAGFDYTVTINPSNNSLIIEVSRWKQ